MDATGSCVFNDVLICKPSSALTGLGAVAIRIQMKISHPISCTSLSQFTSVIDKQGAISFDRRSSLVLFSSKVFAQFITQCFQRSFYRMGTIEKKQ